MTLLKELSPAAGSINIGGKVAYASQEPWILSGMRWYCLVGPLAL